MNSNKLDKPRSPWRRRLKRGIPLLLLAAVTFYMRDVIEANWNYNSLYEAAEAEGAILTISDMRNKYAAKDEENAAPILKPICDRLSSPEMKKYKDVISNEMRTEPTPADPKSDAPTLQQSMASLEQAMTGIEASLLKTKLDFHYQYELGHALALPEFSELRYVTRVFLMRARLLCQAGQAEQAAEKIRLAFHIAKLTDDSPLLIAALVRINMEISIFKEITLLAKSKPNDSALRHLLREATIEWGGPVDPRSCFDFELFSSWDFATHPRERSRTITEMSPDTPLTAFVTQSYVPGLTRAWRARTLDWITKFHRGLRESKGDPIAFCGTDGQFYFDDNHHEGLSNNLNALLCPVVSQAGLAMVKVIASHEICLSTLDLLDERQKLGHWPAKLPVERRDPFGQKSLRYRLEGDRPRVWSVGPDCKDSDGKTTKEDRTSDDLACNL